MTQRARRPGAGATRARASFGRGTPVPFPGRVVKIGEPDASVVLALQRRLNAVGCGPIDVDGVFGPQTAAAVKLYQARFPDLDGQPLRVDGLVGAVTWAALFGRSSVPVPASASDPLLAAVLAFAASQLGVMEKPPGSNRGPEVDRYLRSVGLDPTRGSYPWCAAFVYYCFKQAAARLGCRNPAIRTASVLDHWSRAGQAGITRVTAAAAHLNESLVKPGLVFLIDTGDPGGAGHAGLVSGVAAGKLVTIEGNTNDGGSREGVGVFRRDGRRIRDVNLGFVDYSGRTETA